MLTTQRLVSDDSIVKTGRFLDVSRLLSRLHRRTPTGIDRVEFAYARHYLGRDVGECARGLVTTPVNTGLLSRRTVNQLMRTAEARWLASDDLPSNPAWARLRDILAPIEPAQPQAAMAVGPSRDAGDAAARAMIGRAYAEAVVNGVIGRSPHAVAPSWYLHVSHINLHSPARIGWLKSSRLRSMFLVHDLIPLSHPEYFLPGETGRHRTRMETIARQADVVIFNSSATKDAWDGFVAENHLPQPSGAVVPLGTEEVFLKCGPQLHSDVPYFVVVGTLESRKNVSFLLHVWKSWVTSNPHSRIVIVGRRGRHSENAVDLIDRSAALAPSVVQVGELDDAGLAALLRGARALLAPSLIEGFGIPIAEALALGVPVIASNIAAHREVGKDCTEYLDPLDGPAWFRALDDYAASPSPRRENMQRAASGYRSMTWPQHFHVVEKILSDRS